MSIGRVPLYLLDTVIEKNNPWNRGISARLYAGDPKQRLHQKIVLGISGSEVLETIGVKCAVTHLNKRHPALADGKRIHSKVLYKGFKTSVRGLDSFFSDY